MGVQEEAALQKGHSKMGQEKNKGVSSCTYQISSYTPINCRKDYFPFLK